MLVVTPNHQIVLVIDDEPAFKWINKLGCGASGHTTDRDHAKKLGKLPFYH